MSAPLEQIQSYDLRVCASERVQFRSGLRAGSSLLEQGRGKGP